MDHILLIDAAPLIYASFNSVGHLKASTGEPTGLRYGFTRAVRSYQEKLRADLVVIAHDLPGPVEKAQHLPHYKSNRTLTPEKVDMYSQVPALRELLDLTCWTQLEAPGYEADDLIGAVARAKGQRGHRVTIVSPDNDLLQLVNENVHVFRPGSAKKHTKDRLLKEDDVFATFGVHPEYLCIYRSIVGDQSDNLPGLALRGIEKHELQEFLNRQGRSTKPMTPDQFFEALCGATVLHSLLGVTADERIRANFLAMSLPTPPNLIVKKGKKDREGLAALFRKLEFNSMSKYLDQLSGTKAECLLTTQPA